MLLGICFAKWGKKVHEVNSHQKIGFELPLEGPLHAASFSIDAHKSGKKEKGKKRAYNTTDSLVVPAPVTLQYNSSGICTKPVQNSNQRQYVQNQ